VKRKLISQSQCSRVISSADPVQSSVSNFFVWSQLNSFAQVHSPKLSRRVLHSAKRLIEFGRANQSNNNSFEKISFPFINIHHFSSFEKEQTNKQICFRNRSSSHFTVTVTVKVTVRSRSPLENIAHQFFTLFSTPTFAVREIPS
jgi:hypothetical protein